MRIVLVNYHYFVNGGPDRYFFNIQKALVKQGHTVIPFCFDYDETWDSPHRSYFPAPPTGRGPAIFDQQRLGLLRRAKALAAMYYNGQVNRRFRQLLRNESPDLVYMIYLSSSFLPNLIGIAKREFGLPVVYRVSDFHMYCPTYLLSRAGGVCTECRQTLWSAVRYKCVKGSRLMSAARALQIKLFRGDGNYRAVDMFVCPTSFMRQYMIESGFDADRIVAIATFAEDLKRPSQVDAECVEQPILYCGNITEEKGAEILVRAYCMATTTLKLVLAGKYNAQYRCHLESLIPEGKKQFVLFTGFLEGESLRVVQESARFVVHPVVWYENSPNSVLEAMSMGKAVIASDIGSMPELIRNGANGRLVATGDVCALARAIEDFSTMDLSQMGLKSREAYLDRHTRGIHYNRLMEVFESLVSKGQGFAMASNSEW